MNNKYIHLKTKSVWAELPFTTESTGFIIIFHKFENRSIDSLSFTKGTAVSIPALLCLQQTHTYTLLYMIWFSLLFSVVYTHWFYSKPGNVKFSLTAETGLSLVIKPKLARRNTHTHTHTHTLLTNWLRPFPVRVTGWGSGQTKARQGQTLPQTGQQSGSNAKKMKTEYSLTWFIIIWFVCLLFFINLEHIFY